MKNYPFSLEEKGIYIVDDKIKYDREEKNYFKQIENIYLFNNAISPYINNTLPRIGASIGKEINSYELQIIFIERYVKSLELKKDLSLVDYYLIKYAVDILELGKKSINHIYNNNYKSLIERSMINYEVCLGRVDENNLNVVDNKIFIRNYNYLTYNLKEHDIYSYIKRLKRKKIDKNLEEVIKYYIDISGLNEDSKEYIRGLASYPNEQLRVIEKYILKRIDLDVDKSIELLEKARIMDSRGIVI